MLNGEEVVEGERGLKPSGVTGGADRKVVNNLYYFCFI